MRFDTDRSLTINRDRLFVPICDRWLPNHPKERYGKLPYWYLRSRFFEYGTVKYDLPCRSIRRHSEYNEKIWHRVSKLGEMELEKFFPIGALLPFHPLFFEAKSTEVKGDKINLNEPWGFRYE